jgi:hypothetical protein
VSSRRSVRPLSSPEVERLTTPRLLAYRNALLNLQDDPASSDYDEADLASLDPELIHFKSDALWHTTYSSITRSLATRRHDASG